MLGIKYIQLLVIFGVFHPSVRQVACETNPSDVTTLRESPRPASATSGTVSSVVNSVQTSASHPSPPPGIAEGRVKGMDDMRSLDMRMSRPSVSRSHYPSFDMERPLRTYSSRGNTPVNPYLSSRESPQFIPQYGSGQTRGNNRHSWSPGMFQSHSYNTDPNSGYIAGANRFNGASTLTQYGQNEPSVYQQMFNKWNPKIVLQSGEMLSPYQNQNYKIDYQAMNEELARKSAQERERIIRRVDEEYENRKRKEESERLEALQRQRQTEMMAAQMEKARQERLAARRQQEIRKEMEGAALEEQEYLRVLAEVQKKKKALEEQRHQMIQMGILGQDGGVAPRGVGLEVTALPNYPAHQPNNQYSPDFLGRVDDQIQTGNLNPQLPPGRYATPAFPGAPRGQYQAPEFSGAPLPSSGGDPVAHGGRTYQSSEPIESGMTPTGGHFQLRDKNKLDSLALGEKQPNPSSSSTVEDRKTPSGPAGSLKDSHKFQSSFMRSRTSLLDEED